MMADAYDVHNARFDQPSADEMDASLRKSFGVAEPAPAHDPSDPADDGDVWNRLAAVQRDLKAPKNQNNNFGGYKYRSCEDILEAVKPLLARERLAMTISDTLECLGDRYYVKATARVISRGGRGGVAQVSAYAREAADRKGMDDSQVTGSASSYARKYALNGLFLIDDTKDADTNEHTQQRQNAPAPSGSNERPSRLSQVQNGGTAPQRPVQRVTDGEYMAGQGEAEHKRTDQQGKALWKISNGNRDVIAGWCQPYGVSNDRDLTEAQAAEILTQYGGS